MAKKEKQHYLNELMFDGEIIIADPCFEYDEEVVVEKLNVKSGLWHGYVYRQNQNTKQNPDMRNTMLVSLHDEVVNMPYKLWKNKGRVSVESGQAGIFTKESYRNDKLVEENIDREELKYKMDVAPEGGKWYEYASNGTLDTDIDADCVLDGFISSSGYGDGSYDIFVLENKDKEIVGIKIEFMYKREDEHRNDINF